MNLRVFFPGRWRFDLTRGNFLDMLCSMNVRRLLRPRRWELISFLLAPLLCCGSILGVSAISPSPNPSLAAPSVTSISAPVSAHPSSPATNCPAPVLAFTVNIPKSTAMSPDIVLYEPGLVEPAKGRVDWGESGKYSVHGIQPNAGAIEQTTEISSKYDAPGTYTMRAAITDACNKTL